MFNQKLKRSRTTTVLKVLLGSILGVFAVTVHAATSMSMGCVASTITGSFANLTQLVTATAYLAGMGFAVGAIIKFKAHKDNPGQVPIGQPVGLLMVAAALLFLPTILGVTGTTVFNQSTTVNSATGVSSF